MTSTKRPRVFFDISIGGSPAQRVIMELFTDAVPRTAENFRCEPRVALHALRGRRWQDTLETHGHIFPR